MIIAVVPSSDPAAATDSKSIATSRCAPVSRGVEEPPGVQQASRRPGSIPPQDSSRIWRAVVPSGHS